MCNHTRTTTNVHRRFRNERTGRRRTRWFFAIATLPAVALASGCTDSSRMMRPGASGVGRRDASIANTALSAASGIAASDIAFDLTIDKTSATGSSTSRLHIGRSRSGASGWRTTFSIVDDPRLASMPRNPRRPAQVVVADDGTFTFYRADGSAMPAPDPAYHFPSVPGVTLPTSSGARRTTGKTRISTAWLDGLFKSRDARTQELATLAASSPSPTRDGNGRDHYLRKVAGHTVDVAVDPAARSIAAIAVTDDHGNSQRVDHEYGDTQSGVSVRRRTVVRQSTPRGDQTVTMTLSNITVDGQGVKP